MARRNGMATLKAIALAVFTALGATACSSSGGGGDTGEPQPQLAPGSGPLSVVVEGPRRARISEPAYLAVFEVVHRAGTAMVAPYRPQENRVLPAGVHVRTQPMVRDFVYQQVRTWRSPSGQSYTLAIASYDPMDIDRFIQDPTLLRNAMGPAYEDERAAEAALLDILIPNRKPGRWASDYRSTGMFDPNRR
jgi:hypothetical protein